MNDFDRRRIIVAGLITLTVLAAVWLFNSGASDGNESSTCTNCADSEGNSAPATTEYEPHPPLFIGGSDDSIPPRIVSVATAGIDPKASRLTFILFTSPTSAPPSGNGPMVYMRCDW